MQSLKQLLDERNKHVADARQILERAKAESRALSAQENQQADGLLDKAGEADAAIAAYQKGDRLASRLADAEGNLHSEVPRQTAYSIPGSQPGKTARGDEPMTLSVAGHDLELHPGTPAHTRAQLSYRKAWVKYLCGQGSGAALGLQTSAHQESLGLQVRSNPQGGYLAPPQFVDKLIKFLDNSVFMRQLATVLPPMPTAVSIGVPVYTSDPGDSTWTTEVPNADIAEDTGMAFAKREFMPHLFVKLVKASRKMVRSSVIDIENWIVRRLGYKFAVTEEEAYCTGSGAQQPLGVFTASNDGLPISQDVIAAGSTSLIYDDLVNCLTSLKVQYQKESTWLANRAFVKAVRKLKNSNGDPLWSGGFNGMGLVNGMPDTILNRPYVQSEYTPNTYTTGLYVAALGDWKSAYWIADTLDLEVEYIDQLFTLRNQVGFLGRKETDGAPVLPEAAVRLRML